METFHTLFGSLLGFVYHCFDRIVIQGYLPLLTRPEHIVHFFRDVHGVSPLTKDVLAKRTQEYQQWVEAFARNHRIPIEWPGRQGPEDEEAQEGRLRPTLRSANGAAAALRGLLHLQEPGTGAEVWHPRPEVPDRRPRLPDRDPAALPLHALLLLHPG